MGKQSSTSLFTVEHFNPQCWFKTIHRVEFVLHCPAELFSCSFQICLIVLEYLYLRRQFQKEGERIGVLQRSPAFSQNFDRFLQFAPFALEHFFGSCF